MLLVRREGALEEEEERGLGAAEVEVLSGTAGFTLLLDPLFRNGFSFNEGFAEVSGSPNLVDGGAAGVGDGFGVGDVKAGGAAVRGVPQEVQKRSLDSTADQGERRD